MTAFVNNKDASLIVDFLGQHGPAPYDALLALAVCHSWNKDGKQIRAKHRLGLALRKLELLRCAYRLNIAGKEFWFPDGYGKANGHIDPATQEQIAWKAVHQEEREFRRQELTALLSDKLFAAGSYLANGEIAMDGARYPVRFNMQKDIFYFGDKFYCHLSDLKDRNKSFKDCLLPLDAEKP